MKAMVFRKYGGPEVLQLKEVAKPSPGPNEVLVKVHSTAVNDYDWSLIRGKPYLYRLMFGLLKPKRYIPGMELAGIVEACGADTTLLRAGDAVYGDISDYGFGSFAEYICVNEKALTKKPGAMSFAEAASIPHAAMLAMQGLYNYGNIQECRRILINGAGGGVGTFGLQLARLHGAEVTGVDTGAKLRMMQSLGFDHVFDYQQEDFTKNGMRYDLILDTKTNRSPFAYFRSLNPDGRYVSVGGQLPRLFQALCLKPLLSLFSQRQIHVVALKPNKDLAHINELYESNKLKCIIDGPYPLDKAAWAIQYFGDAKHSGKLVISVAEPD